MSHFLASQLPSAVERLGLWLGLIATAIVSLGVIARFPPLRWLLRTVFGDPLGRFFRAEVREATEDIRVMASDTHHRVKYHLGSNDTTTPTHERISRLEVAHGLEPIAQQDDPPLGIED